MGSIPDGFLDNGKVLLPHRVVTLWTTLEVVGLISLKAEACLVLTRRYVHEYTLALHAHNSRMSFIETFAFLAPFAYVASGKEDSRIQAVQL